MTNTEKFILEENGAKETVTEILKILDGKSYSFADSALKTAKKFLNEDSNFNAKNALKKISELADIVPTKPAKKKTVNNFYDGRKLYSATVDVNHKNNFFLGALKHAKVTDFSDDVLTLTFDSDPIAKYFEETHKKTFEESASLITGRKITIEILTEV